MMSEDIKNHKSHKKRSHFLHVLRPPSPPSRYERLLKRPFLLPSLDIGKGHTRSLNELGSLEYFVQNYEVVSLL